MKYQCEKHLCLQNNGTVPSDKVLFHLSRDVSATCAEGQDAVTSRNDERGKQQETDRSLTASITMRRNE